jgi:EmrB/QacA subfamily drug resistance transporter
MSTTAPSPSSNGSAATVSAPDPRRWSAMALLALVQFMLTLDSTIVNVALPTIKTDLGFSTSGLAWVVNGYTLMAGGFLIVGGRIADIVGRRRMFIIGTAIFAVASATSGLAQSDTMMIVSRFAQGFGGALATPAALALVVLLFPDSTERAKAIGAWGGISVIGATLGVVLSGIIIDLLSWRWIFLVNIPVAAVVLFVLPGMVKESRKEGSRELDIIGAVLITGSLVAIVDGLLNASTHGWGSTNVLLPIAIGVGLMVAFLLTQITFRNPLVPRNFFKNRTRVAANLVTIFGAGAFLGMFFTVTLYMQDVLHFHPLKAGLAWGPFGLAVLVGIAASTKILPRFGVKIGLIFSYTISGIGLVLLSRIGTHGDYAGVLLPGMILMAFGQGISFPAVQTAGVHQLGPQDAGLGSAVQNAALQLGGSLGLAVLVTIGLRHTASKLGAHVPALTAATDGYSLALKLSAAAMFIGALLAAALFERVKFVPPEELALEAAQAAAGEPTSSVPATV